MKLYTVILTTLFCLNCFGETRLEFYLIVPPKVAEKLYKEYGDKLTYDHHLTTRNYKVIITGDKQVDWLGIKRTQDELIELIQSHDELKSQKWEIVFNKGFEKQALNFSKKLINKVQTSEVRLEIKTQKPKKYIENKVYSTLSKKFIITDDPIYIPVPPSPPVPKIEKNKK